jgi:peptidyl-prolyl cis-trans isomerase B (cyclophilin B)
LLKKLVLLILPLCLIAGYSIAQEEKEGEKMTPEKNPIVKIDTNHGDIYLEVFLKETPIHAQNFLTKVKEGKYDSLTFHRVVKGFVIQGGDPTGTGMGSMGTERLPDEESPYPQVEGTVAMARSPQGASNCQFYINLKDNTFLDKQKFSSFAKVVKGMDVVHEIGNVKTKDDKPVEPVIMENLSVVESVPQE